MVLVCFAFGLLLFVVSVFDGTVVCVFVCLFLCVLLVCLFVCFCFGLCVWMCVCVGGDGGGESCLVCISLLSWMFCTGLYTQCPMIINANI